MLIDIIVMLHPLPKCGALLSIPYHKVLRDVKKTNAYNLFLLDNNFFPFLLFDVAMLLPCPWNTRDFPMKVDDILIFYV
jgi:hypothetical protein